jgi:palmitoyltransferase
MLLLLVCGASFACVLMLVLLPTTGWFAPFGSAHALANTSHATGWGSLAAYVAIWGLAVTSAVTVARVPPGHIPLWLYSREPGDQAYFHNVLQAVEKKLDGSLRFCRKCGAFKPDLAHHSRELGLCILCYQHWDIWANNAIGFYNHKMYLLALAYGAAAHALGVLLLAPGVLRAMTAAGISLPELPARVLLALWIGDEPSVLAFACLSLAASVLLGGASLVWLLFHVLLVARGTTAHSFFRQSGFARNKPAKQPIPGRPFDFGPRGNFGRACGRHPFLWCLPTNQGVEGNGIFFELNIGDVEVPWARYKS